jgi:(heptosyl)LPS beta-1,4-glucosyltransferase
VCAGAMDPADGYAVDRRGDFLGVVLPNQARRAKRRGFVRLYNRTRSRWDEAMPVHEVVRVPGRLHALDGILLHWNDLTLDELATLFNRYATVEAEDLHRRGVRAGPLALLGRPVLRFLWLYLARGEARLGTRGLIHAALKATSEFLRYAKLWELQHPREREGERQSRSSRSAM